MNKELSYFSKRIFYRVIGEGKPVILLHGFGEDGEIWNHQVDYLRKNYRLIVPDLPGSGQSEMVGDMSVEGMAEVIKTIIDMEFPSSPGREGREVALIGHSMGGYITLAFAEKFPGYLNAFGLFHSTAYADSEEKKANRRKGIAFINQNGAFEFLKTTLPNLFSSDSKTQIPDSIEELVARGHNFTPPALVSYYEAMIQRPNRAELLKNTRVPVLFIMGKYDTAVPMEDVLKQCHLPEKSYIHILRKSSHMGMLEETGVSNSILDEFLWEI